MDPIVGGKCWSGKWLSPALRKKINLIVICKAGLAFWALFFAIFFINFRKYVKDTAMLRNFGAGSPYSLAWTQMAFCFCLVVVSYALIWLVTGDMNCIPESVLILVGVGAGTALGARVIDENKSSQDEERKTWLNEQKVLLATLVQLQAQPSTTKSEPLISQARQRLEVVNSLLNPPSQGFFNDINGVSVHRMQMVVWTLVLGVIFICKVYQELTMPEFNGTLLALIGISSGTYLGFKIPEKHKRLAIGSKDQTYYCNCASASHASSSPACN